MKKLLFVLFAFTFLAANAQTVDEIIQQHGNVMGGLDNVNKLQSLKKTGTITLQGAEFPITVQVINNKAMRSDIDVLGQKITICYKDGKGWTINPFAGISTATDVAGVELAEYKSQTMIASQLMDYKTRGHQVELLGKETMDSITAYKIKLINHESGKITYYFIDSSTFLLIKLITTMQDNVGDETEVVTTFSDLKDIGGFKFNMTQTQTINGQPYRNLKFQTVELNVSIDEKIFEKE